MLANGTIVTYTGTWNPSFSSADDMVQKVLQKLESSGLISVSQPIVDAGIVTTFGGPFVVTLQLQIENGLGFDTEIDVISIIRHWVYENSGNFPTSDSVPRIQTPKVLPSNLPPGSSYDTGQPGATAPKKSGCISGGYQSLDGSFSLSCWWDNLTTKGLSTIGLLAIAAIVGIGIFLYAKAPRVAVV